MRTTRTVQKQCFALVLPVILLFGAGTASATIACYECHGSKVPPDYRPVDAPYRNITTGGFQGNHRTHLSPADTFNGCVRCHPGSDKYTSSHRDGKIKLAANINNSRLTARYRNSTSAFMQTPTPLLGTCTNVNCHFEQVTPIWGAAPLVYPGGCAVCHGAPPSGGLTGAAGSHAKHDLYYPGAANCQACHGPSHTSFEHATSVGRPLIVKPRHTSDSQAGTYSGPVNDYLPSQVNLFGTCSTFYCHSDGTRVATGQLNAFTSPAWGTVAACDACHGYPPGYISGAPKANSHGYPHSQSCDTCHNATTTDGLTISDQTKHANGVYDVVPGAGLVFSYTFKTTGGSCTNVVCHATRTGSRDWGANPDKDCNGCHESPPNTPSHLKHFSGTASQAVYGSTSTATANATGYLFNCGNCHPIDRTKHRNGIVEVELYNAGAPAGSIKARPDNASAVYTRVGARLSDGRGYPYYNGTCNNVYCHSYNSWTTPGGVPPYTSYSSYRPANLVETRMYKTVTWGGPSLGCTGCHENPPRSYASAGNDGGAGNSHSWIDAGGGENLHTYNMGYRPGLSCTTCHNDTVKALNAISYNKTIFNNKTTVFTQYSAVPITNFGRHVNGKVDVAFDKDRRITYSSSFYGQVTFKPLSSSYTAATKTCSNIACHFREKVVVWGTPYRWYNNTECNRCHRQ